MIESTTIYRQSREQLLDELGLEVVTGSSARSFDFREVSQFTVDHPNLLTAFPADLQNSYARGRSALLVQGDRIMGHTRFIDLLNEPLAAQIGLPSKFPQIWEMGTGLMLNSVQGRGLNTYLRLRLYDSFADQLRAERLLIIGTTKSPELRGVVSRLAVETGLDFAFCNRETLPYIAPFTCACRPNFGSGYQFGEICPQPDRGLKLGFLDGNQLPVLSANRTDKLACTMLVSSGRLALQIDNSLSRQFGQRKDLVNALVSAEYYNS